MLALLVPLVCDGLLGVYLVFDPPRELSIVEGVPRGELDRAVGGDAFDAQGTNWWQPRMLGHPYKAYINLPGTRFWRRGDESGKWQLNQTIYDFGLIDRGTVVNHYGHQVSPEDIDVDSRGKGREEFRIFFVGGSTTYQPWPHLLAELLNRNASQKDRKYIAINGGVGGYTSQENLIDLAISGFSYAPDLVVAYLPVNDIYLAAKYPDFKRDYTHMRVPLKLDEKEVVKKPRLELSSYPFTVRVIEWLRYKEDFQEYQKKSDIGYYQMRRGFDYLHTNMDDEVYDRVVDSVIDNIRSMKAMCEERGVPLLLITQKMFRTGGSYYEYMDPYVREANERILRSPHLEGVTVLDMARAFPDEWSDRWVGRVAEDFPGEGVEQAQGMAYDSMHFTPGGLKLFAGIVEDFLAEHPALMHGVSGE